VHGGNFLRGLIEAMTATVRFDHMETPAEVELVRTIAASLHCPLPGAAWSNQSQTSLCSLSHGLKEQLPAGTHR